MNDDTLAPRDFVARYDRMILGADMRELYGGGYYNVGSWTPRTRSLGAACADLVRRVAAPAMEADGCRPDELVLDVGCGLGDGSAEVAALLPGRRVVGVNLSRAQVLEARRRHPGLPFRAMDASRLRFRAASIGCIVSVEAAFHFRPRQAFLVEAFRVLRPGGLLLLSDMLFHRGAPLPWWAPRENGGQDEAAYRHDCSSAGFVIERCEDASPTTLQPFCEHLDCRYPGTGAGQALAAQVSAYLLVALRKPVPQA